MRGQAISLQLPVKAAVRKAVLQTALDQRSESGGRIQHGLATDGVMLLEILEEIARLRKRKNRVRGRQTDPDRAP